LLLLVPPLATYIAVALAVHHAIEDLNATNCHHHWTEGLLRVALILVPLMLLIDLRVPEIAALSSIIGAWGQVVHSNTRMTLGPLERLFVSPRFHRIHHSLNEQHEHKNFSQLFPVFDMVFGTAYFPKEDEAIDTGLRDKRESTTLWQYLFALRDRASDDPYYWREASVGPVAEGAPRR
jgi:sterol desaturase/sphingolipid hydroxylase (fatty acid hydroxylase superfamily)